MAADLGDILQISRESRRAIVLQVSCPWNEELEAFEPVWAFLNDQGNPLGIARRTINFSNFFNYLRLNWLGPLRDADQEFSPRASRWARLLQSVHIPEDVEEDILESLKGLDEKVKNADPLLSKIATRIGDATDIVISEQGGDAKLNTLPMTIEDMLLRTGILLRNEGLHPWLPLSQHGQGLQSLAVIFLYQALVSQQLEENDYPGMRAVFAIEEPEAHLHPQAARTLWEKVNALVGQKLITTHSPYFAQYVPLHALRLVRLHKGCSKVSVLPRQVVSKLPWNEQVDKVVSKLGDNPFVEIRGQVASKNWFPEQVENLLAKSFPGKGDELRKFRHGCRVLLSEEEVKSFGYMGRRIRGEIFFAQRWILVEGVVEYLLIHAMSRAFEWPLDTHGVSVIDFQQSASKGGAGVFASLAQALNIPWHMIVDGDSEGDVLGKKLLERGFTQEDLEVHFEKLPGTDLEGCLVKDFNNNILLEILAELDVDVPCGSEADTIKYCLRRNKTSYINLLCERIDKEHSLAAQMPSAFVKLIMDLKAGLR